MQGKSLFLRRIVPRTREWQCRFPALCAASQDPASPSRGRQIVVVCADDAAVRCIFFSQLGSILDFRASWTEIAEAETWFSFVKRWNFWIVAGESSLSALWAAGHSPDHHEVASTSAPPALESDDELLSLLDRLDAKYRPHSTPCSVLTDTSIEYL